MSLDAFENLSDNYLTELMVFEKNCECIALLGSRRCKEVRGRVKCSRKAR